VEDARRRESNGSDGMSQIIIIDSAEALAEQIHQEYIKNPLVNVKLAVLNCLHPIEVPSDAVELVKMIRSGSPFSSDGNPYLSDTAAAALITAHSRTVLRVMLHDIYSLWPKDYFTLDKGIDAAIEKYGYHAE